MRRKEGIILELVQLESNKQYCYFCDHCHGVAIDFNGKNEYYKSYGINTKRMKEMSKVIQAEPSCGHCLHCQMYNTDPILTCQECEFSTFNEEALLHHKKECNDPTEKMGTEEKVRQVDLPDHSQLKLEQLDLSTKLHEVLNAGIVDLLKLGNSRKATEAKEKMVVALQSICGIVSGMDDYIRSMSSNAKTYTTVGTQTDVETVSCSVEIQTDDANCINVCPIEHKQLDDNIVSSNAKTYTTLGTRTDVETVSCSVEIQTDNADCINVCPIEHKELEKQLSITKLQLIYTTKKLSMVQESHALYLQKTVQCEKQDSLIKKLTLENEQSLRNFRTEKNRRQDVESLLENVRKKSKKTECALLKHKNISKETYRLLRDQEKKSKKI